MVRLITEAGDGTYPYDAGRLACNGEASSFQKKNRVRLLHELQNGICVGCDTRIPWWMATSDHKVALSSGGVHSLENGLAMCGHCNSSKGVGTLAELRERNVEKGILPGPPSPQLQFSYGYR